MCRLRPQTRLIADVVRQATTQPPDVAAVTPVFLARASVLTFTGSP